MPTERIDISAVVRSPEQEFPDWREEQDFDYQRTASAVIDYTNEHIDYNELDAVVAENADNTDISELSRVYKMLGFHADSSEAETVTRHVEGYISAQS
jgi:hypothetical protein